MIAWFKRSWFGLSLLALLVLALPVFWLWGMNILGREGPLNADLEKNYSLTYHIPVPWWGVLLLYLVMSPTGRYLVRAAWEEARILARRRPIVDLVDDSTIAPAVRQKLRLVLAARAFASDSIHLRAGQSFTTYSRLEHDTLVLVLSGAYRDRLKAYTWWFPIVGRVPYKGFFVFGAATAAARALDHDAVLGALQKGLGVEDEELHEQSGCPKESDESANRPSKWRPGGQVARIANRQQAKADDRQHDEDAVNPNQLTRKPVEFA